MGQDTKPAKPTKAPPAPPSPQQVEGVRKQRAHIKELTGRDPLRGGIAD